MEQGEEHRNLLKLKRLVDGEKLNDLLGYLEENWDGIYGFLKSKVGALTGKYLNGLELF